MATLPLYSPSLMGMDRFPSNLYTILLFQNIQVGSRRPEMSSLCLLCPKSTHDPSCAICNTPLPRAGPASPYQACSPGQALATDHLLGVGYNLEGWLQPLQDLSQVPTNLRSPTLLSLAWQKHAPFCFEFPFFSVYSED